MKEELKVVAAPGHHLLQQTSVSIKDLEKGNTFINRTRVFISNFI